MPSKVLWKVKAKYPDRSRKPGSPCGKDTIPFNRIAPDQDPTALSQAFDLAGNAGLLFRKQIGIGGWRRGCGFDAAKPLLRRAEVPTTKSMPLLL